MYLTLIHIKYGLLLVNSKTFLTFSYVRFRFLLNVLIFFKYRVNLDIKHVHQ